jgi:transcriptional regulator with XRE-family HTH domain
MSEGTVQTVLWGDPKVFGALIREEREKKGWSQEKLGQKAGVATNSIFSVEHGKPTQPRTRAWVCGALGIRLV